ncbi:MAG: DUF3566 domain-containing protein [Ferrimicrobium sp.]
MAKPAHSKLTLFGVDSSSLVRVALVFYFFLFVVVLIAAVILWAIFGMSGYEARANHLIDQLLGSATYHLIGWQVFLVFLGLGIFGVILCSVASLIVVQVLNMTIEQVGGITLFLGTDRPRRTR